MLSSQLHLGLSTILFPTDFPTKTLQGFFYSPMRIICPALLKPLNLITILIFGEECKFNFLQYPVPFFAFTPETFTKMNYNPAFVYRIMKLFDQC
jgi:hypothetical protein